MNEIDEIRMIENETFLEDVIQKFQKSISELIQIRAKTDKQIFEAEKKLGELLAYKVMFGVARRR